MVTGVSELQRALVQQLPLLVKGRVEEAMKQAVAAVVDDMEARAPVYVGDERIRRDKRHKGQPIRPGALRDSIGWKWGDAPKGTVSLGSVQTGFSEKGLSKITIYAGDKEAFYARWAEFGTSKWAGNPFFFGTWRQHKAKVKGWITRAIRRAIKEAVESSNGALSLT